MSAEESRKAASKRYQEQNQEAIRAYRKEYYKKNKEKLRAYHTQYMKEYYPKNKDKYTEQSKRWRKESEENKQKHREAVKRWREQNPEKAAAQDKKYNERRATGRFKNRLDGIAARSRKRGFDCDLTVEYMETLVVDVCPILGIPLVYGKAGMGWNDNQAQLDRIDNSKGYVEGNVQFISGRANRIKNDSTFEEIEKLYKFMLASKTDIEKQ